MGLKKSEMGVRTTGLDSIQVDDKAREESEDVLSRIPKLAAEDYLVGRGVAETDPEKRAMYFQAQQAVRTDGVHALAKSIQAEIVQAFSKN